MEKKFISLITYLHNNAGNVETFLDHVLPKISERFEQFELIFVDDECTDHSVEELKAYVAAHKPAHNVSIVRMGFYQGIESSMNAGRDAAIGDFVYEFDDITVDYDPAVLDEVYEKCLEGYDIVTATGSRRMKFTSKLFYSLYNRTSRGNGKIGPETFRLISRRAINRVKSMGQYIPYRKAVYANCGLKTAQVHYESREGDRKAVKKSGFAERRSLALDSFIYFTNILETVSTVISGIFLVVTVVMGIYILMDYFNVNKPVEGWVSTMGFLSLGFFGVFALLTIILKYLSVLLNLVFKQQRYLVSDIEKINNG